MFTKASIALPGLALATVLVTPLAYAQYENGSLTGTIRDSSGAPIAGAQVVVTNEATAAHAEATTGGSGDYDVPQLRVGSYRITVSAPGFSSAVAQNITVSVGARQHIDLSLNAGSTATNIEVSDVSLQLETETSQRDQTITQYQSEALPLVTRNYSDLLGLVTGVRQAPSAATTSSINSLVRAGSYNVNGQRSIFNNFLLDGMDNNSYGESNQGFDNQIIAVPPDSVAQFSVVTNNESAEYGRSSGATINVASSSGSNRFHGTAYDFFRNTVLNAAGYFKPEIVSPTGEVPFQKPTFNRNQFGGNIGGPVLKDKLFFFLDYEGFRQVLRPLSALTLPTQNELNGDLVVPVRNPLTGVTYAANTPIPTAAINPLSRQVLSYFSQIQGLPQNGLASTGLNQNDYSVQVPFTDNSDKGDLRLDYTQSPASSWFLRISDRKETGVNFAPIPLPLDGQSNGSIRILDQQVALGYTHLFGANKILDARFGISRTKAGKYSLSIGDNAFAIPGLPTNPVVAGGLPTTAVTGFTGFGRQSTNPQWQNPSLLDPKANYTWVLGHHSLKFGAEYEHVWMAVNDNNPLYGSFTYGGGYSAVGNTAVTDNYWADFLFGLTSNYSLANYFVAHLRQTLVSGYAQDDWKVSPRLTLNLGVRWEYGSPYSEQHNYISDFDPTTQTLLTVSPGAVAGNGITPITAGGVYGHTLIHPDLNDFAPRVGFAFAPTPRTALRGGFGTSYVHYTRAGSGDILAINAPQAQFASVNQVAPTAANHCAMLPAQIVNVGSSTPTCYATADQGFPGTLATVFNSATDNVTYVPSNTRDSYVESYFFSLQQTLAKNTVLDIAYVGNHGLKLQGFLNANQKNPSNNFARTFGNWPSDITEALNGFISNYNSLQVRYEQRSERGLTLLNSFTWEHSLDNASASLEGNTPSPQDGNNIAADYSQSDYNLPVADVTSLVYELPVGHGRPFLTNARGPMQALLGGWQASVINTAQAGTPFNLTYTPNSATAVSQQISATYRGANEYRPNIVPNQPITQGRSVKAAGTGYIQYVNLNAFSLPATREGTTLLSPFGNASRNPGRTPMFNETDLDLNKKFDTPIEGVKVEFRSELYNLFNHTNLYLPSSGLGGTLSSFNAGGALTGGTPTSGGVVSSTFEPRIVQFALKLLY
ncbi:TonB-dependent receptor [Acidipila sp. EB88]|uniref:TonB-dependent receptor n=1 Tax=Acidipila sp. EB88 TaxID=2305226 RepID=UPI000F5DA8CE|nr:TonB-dependent receptor [Acidipila sp. EB88]RRA48148.1 TonB-dependent receptor [Acidipila sp. EB88]